MSHIDEQIFEALKTSVLYADMSRTVENSPYHREQNVAVHTDMVVRSYYEHASEFEILSDRSIRIGAIACMLHDIGKPSCMLQKHSKERGDYVSFTGHERKSARLAETWLTNNFTAHLSDKEIAAICFIIEQHKPWDIVHVDKVSHIISTIASLLDTDVAEASQLYASVLWADQRGRIPDNQEQHLEHTKEWINRYVYGQISMPVPQRRLFVLIGASGSGKSTWTDRYIKTHPDLDVKIWSLDEMRLRYYNPTDYALAWKASTEDSTFSKRANAELEQMLKQRTDRVIIDNTNVSKKSRAMPLALARKYGYSTVAVYFVNSLDTVRDRQCTRPDKSVPIDAVERQYNSIEMPMLGEFETIIVV